MSCLVPSSGRLNVIGHNDEDIVHRRLWSFVLFCMSYELQIPVIIECIVRRAGGGVTEYSAYFAAN